MIKKGKILLFIFVLLIFKAYSQDTTKKKTDTTFKPITFIMSDNKFNYINSPAPDTITRKRFLWHPLKNIDDIFNYLPGYYLRSMDVGQINQITFNGLDNYSTGVIRHGRPINDMIDGSIDLNLLSRNEISEIEISNGFGNSLYNYANTVNIIQRQQFQFRPHTELAFWQDRYDNEYVDANFSQNFFNGFNFNFGVTKHSYSGKYINSDFDKWLGRFNFNFAPSSKLSFFLYTNYAKMERSLNEGVDESNIDLGNKETVFNPVLAPVINPDAYETKERFDIDLGVLLLAGKNSFTKLQLFESNSFRQYRDPDNAGEYVKTNFHWINYGIKLKEVLNFKIAKNFDLTSNTEIEMDQILRMLNHTNSNYITYSDKFRKYYLLENVDLKYKGFIASGYLRGRAYSYSNVTYLCGGVKGMYTHRFDSSLALSIYSLYNSLNRYSGSGIKLLFGNSNISAEYYFYKHYPSGIISGNNESDFNVRGINAAGNIRFRPVEFNFNVNYAMDYDKLITFPQYSGNLELSYHDVGIKNKLEFKIGVVTRFWSKYTSNRYYGENNNFYFLPNYDSLSIPANATLDFFVAGKINKAVFGLTFENILDRLIYNTGVYPHIDRGGLFNVLSRFNITWYFFD